MLVLHCARGHARSRARDLTVAGERLENGVLFGPGELDHSERVARIRRGVRLRKRTYSVAEVAALTGLSVDAVRGRVRRGSLASVVRDGRRRIPHAELERAGLLPEQASTRSAPIVWSERLPDRLAEGQNGFTAGIVGELLDRLERQSVELAQYRALSAFGGTGPLLQELAHLRARVAALEGAPAQGALPAAGLGGETSPEPSPPSPAGARGGPAESRQLWLPPTAGAPSAVAGAEPRPIGPSQPPPTILPTVRAARFALEALLILGAALGSWLAGVGPVGIILVVGGVWLVVAIAELAAWQFEVG